MSVATSETAKLMRKAAVRVGYDSMQEVLEAAFVYRVVVGYH